MYSTVSNEIHRICIYSRPKYTCTRLHSCFLDPMAKFPCLSVHATYKALLHPQISHSGIIKTSSSCNTTITGAQKKAVFHSGRTVDKHKGGGELDPDFFALFDNFYVIAGTSLSRTRISRGYTSFPRSPSSYVHVEHTEQRNRKCQPRSYDIEAHSTSFHM